MKNDIEKEAEILDRFFGVFNWQPYHIRNVCCTELDNGFTVDTSYVEDVEQYETAVQYKNGNWIIVERCDDKEDAQKMHDKWVDECKRSPKELFDIQIEEMIKINY